MIHYKDTFISSRKQYAGFTMQHNLTALFRHLLVPISSQNNRVFMTWVKKGKTNMSTKRVKSTTLYDINITRKS